MLSLVHIFNYLLSENETGYLDTANGKETGDNSWTEKEDYRLDILLSITSPNGVPFRSTPPELAK